MPRWEYVQIRTVFLQKEGELEYGSIQPSTLGNIFIPTEGGKEKRYTDTRRKSGDWEQKFYLTRTNGKEEELKATNTSTKDYSSIIRLLNQFGDKGWELVSISPVKAGLFSEAGEYKTGKDSYKLAVPMGMLYLLKRQKNEEE